MYVDLNDNLGLFYFVHDNGPVFNQYLYFIEISNYEYLLYLVLIFRK